ncbi:hypothetical protein [Mesomycoplasma lagogenitalium]|uniref:ABC-2 type transporter domain-containing protein n=1 Tax=Mesomycoplasma lagogenitalium TaxID=171286 RepID=A0ABY8LTM5_9BACT|nr:hypothetical protein [Mesomycoplasma lagogenitalium]WGI36592.1 hypothetical protein QEG99_03970 [Mesomycoplasma lagogenitalium]
MLAIFKFINTYFWKSIIGPIFIFLFPIMTMGTQGLSAILLSSFSKTAANSVLKDINFSTVYFSLLSNGILVFSMLIVSFKRTTLVKRIAAIGVNKFYFLLAAISYQFIWAILTILFIPIISFFLFGFYEFTDRSLIFNSGYYKAIPFMLLLFLVSSGIGLLFASIFNNSIASNIVSFIFIQIINIITTLSPALKDNSTFQAIELFLPTSYSIIPMKSIMSTNLYSSFFTSDNWKSYVFPIASLAFVGLSLGLSLKLFKWY